MDLTLSNKFAVPTLLKKLYENEATSKLCRNDAAMCYFAPENKLYVVIIGSDHTDDIVSQNDQVEITWTRAVTGSYEDATCFTTQYAPTGYNSRRFMGESSCVLRQCLHKIPTTVPYSVTDGVLQLPMAFSLVVDDWLRVAHVFNSDPKYPSSVKWADSYKWKINLQLALSAEINRVKCNDRGEKTAALYLDGPCAMTSKCMLRHTKYPRDALFAPNKNGEVCRMIATATNVYAPHTTLARFLDGTNLPQFSFVWVDAMGAWDSGCNVRHMVQTLFAKNHLASNALVAYTVCLRGRTGCVRDRSIRDTNAHIRLIKTWAKRAQYNVSSFVMFLNTTSSPMLTLAFSVKK